MPSTTNCRRLWIPGLVLTLLFLAAGAYIPGGGAVQASAAGSHLPQVRDAGAPTTAGGLPAAQIAGDTRDGGTTRDAGATVPAPPADRQKTQGPANGEPAASPEPASKPAGPADYGERELTFLVAVALKSAGSSDVAGFEIEVPLLPKGGWGNQRILSERLTPEPQSVTTASDGARIARFSARSLSPGSEFELTVEYRLLLDSGVFKPYSQPDDPRLLSAEPKIEVNAPQIQAVATELRGGGDGPVSLLGRILDRTRELIRYDKASPAANKGALAAVQAGSGVCEEYASLFVALARALGIRSRVEVGYAANVLSFGNAWGAVVSGQRSLGTLRHAWAEVYLPEHGWVTVDPCFDRAELPGVASKPISSGTYIADPSGAQPISVRYWGGTLSASQHRALRW